MDGTSVAPVATPIEAFRTASRGLHDAFLPLLGLVPVDDLREELDGQLGRLRGLLDLYCAEKT